MSKFTKQGTANGNRSMEVSGTINDGVLSLNVDGNFVADIKAIGDSKITFEGEPTTARSKISHGKLFLQFFPQIIANTTVELTEAATAA